MHWINDILLGHWQASKVSPNLRICLILWTHIEERELIVKITSDSCASTRVPHPHAHTQYVFRWNSEVILAYTQWEITKLKYKTSKSSVYLHFLPLPILVSLWLWYWQRRLSMSTFPWGCIFCLCTIPLHCVCFMSLSSTEYFPHNLLSVWLIIIY